ncbi:uncharacterized protein BXZ73DRAFT_41987 [Epithele typhae]|uniref:uncharacterized protein n=1 Tax=Epithele typhae TaxID=378194 RepID=UPI002008B7AE|nr:uncharacterized protein BXZ73DRAFT_41987 [Epithele typhae]KAH9941242.1 hypothetical protein BXZ73DRAFT_41987 [Epithele typhae]
MVKIGAGFEIMQVSTGFEPRQIVLGGVPSIISPAEIRTALARFGDVVNVALSDEPRDADAFVYQVTFALADAAVETVARVDGNTLFNSPVYARLQPMKAKIGSGGDFFDGDVLFKLPTARKCAYVGYKTEEAAQIAIARADGKDLRGMQVAATCYTGMPKVGQFNVKYEYLPANATEKDLARFGDYESHMFERPNYQSPKGAIEGLRRQLADYGEVSLDVPPGPNRMMFRVWAHFKDPLAAEKARGDLHGRCPAYIGKQRIFAHHYRSLTYMVPSRKFNHLSQDLFDLHAYLHHKYNATIFVDDKRTATAPNTPVVITFLSENPAEVPEAKAAFDRLLRGDKLTENGRTVWNEFFGTREGLQFLDGLQKNHPMVRVYRDTHRRTLTLFGPELRRSRVRDIILAHARRLASQRQQRHRVAGNLFLTEDLATLRKELGEGSVWFDFLRKELVVCGDEDARKTAKLAIQDAIKRRGQLPRTSSSSNGCPVCLSEPSHPVSLPCNHRWCTPCLSAFLNAAADVKMFPLTCLGDNARCTCRIPLDIVRQLLPPDAFDTLARTAFNLYIHARPKEFQYCPTPDCPQVYRPPPPAAAPAPVLQCPTCLVRICSACGAEHHETRSCRDVSPADEAQFATWRAGHDVKDCPKCKIPIEREAGCNHMTCARCKTHICWACLETFETSGEVYGHMRAIHGGIGGLDVYL